VEIPQHLRLVCQWEGFSFEPKGNWGGPKYRQVIRYAYEHVRIGTPSRLHDLKLFMVNPRRHVDDQARRPAPRGKEVRSDICRNCDLGKPPLSVHFAKSSSYVKRFIEAVEGEL
jgi:hypothetical protein